MICPACHPEPKVEKPPKSTRGDEYKSVEPDPTPCLAKKTPRNRWMEQRRADARHLCNRLGVDYIHYTTREEITSFMFKLYNYEKKRNLDRQRTLLREANKNSTIWGCGDTPRKLPPEEPFMPF